MAFNVVLVNGLVVTPAGPIHADVGIASGRIMGLGPPGSLAAGHEELNVEGMVILPGLIDPHVHFGLGDTIGDDTMVEDFKHNSRDCLIGGITTIATTTMEGREPLLERFERALRCAEAHSWVDYKITSVVGSPAHVEDIGAVVAKGGVSFKFFTGYVGEQAEEFGMDPTGITPGLFFEACEAIARAGSPAFAAIHAEEPYVRAILVDRLRSQGGGNLVTWAESSPEWAESVQVHTYGLVAHSAGVPLYVVHVSSAMTVDTIQQLQSQGLVVVGETLSLFLSTTAEEMDEAGMGGKAKIQPPIRHAADRRRLWQGIRDGVLSVVGTDSLTYSSRFKQGMDFWDCRVGVNPQFPDVLPLLWEEGIHRSQINLATLTRILSENAAKRYGLYPRKGAIALGSDADLVVVDPDKEVRLGVNRFRGRSDYSLWEGRTVRGVPVMTFLRGELVMRNGEIVSDRPRGQYLTTRIPS
jgi:dihydropyrimidinase/dihydroorotase